MNKVFVVFPIDTEGPFTDPNYSQPSQLLGTWKHIDEKFLKIVFSTKFRFAYPDQDNKPAIFSWFILNWTGFRTNPIKHDFGYHKVFDHYNKIWGDKLKKYGDEIAWHYHHPTISGIGNEWGTNWFCNYEYQNLLCRMLIDRNYFPSSYRSGGTIEDNVQSNWLEQWIPFDYSNRNSDGNNWNKKEADGKLAKEIIGDWQKAPKDFTSYHPSEKDFTKLGKMKRVVVNSVDMNSGLHVTTKEEILKAFKKACQGENVILSLFEHDFRNRIESILQIMKWIYESSQITNIGFKYCSASDAVKRLFNYPETSNFELKIDNIGNKLKIQSTDILFGCQPFLAVKYSKYIYNWKPIFKTGDFEWEYELIKEDKNKKFGIAGHDIYGNCFVKTFFV